MVKTADQMCQVRQLTGQELDSLEERTKAAYRGEQGIVQAVGQEGASGAHSNLTRLDGTIPRGTAAEAGLRRLTLCIAADRIGGWSVRRSGEINESTLKAALVQAEGLITSRATRIRT